MEELSFSLLGTSVVRRVTGVRWEGLTCSCALIMLFLGTKAPLGLASISCLGSRVTGHG